MNNKIKQAASRIISSPEEHIIRIVSHYDADGIASAGILCNALLRAHKNFHISNIRTLNDKKIEQLSKEQNDLTIFLDMGSGQIEQIEKIKSKIIILDHHLTTKKSGISDNILQINPRLVGINGTYEACASTLAYLLAEAIDPKNADLISIAVAGIIGDKQHLHGLKGLNKEIVDQGIAKGHIRKEQGIIFTKRVPREMLMESEPFIRGISGRREKIDEFLATIGTDGDFVLNNINDEKARILLSSLLVKLLKQGVQPETVEDFICEKYILGNFDDIDAAELTRLLDASGRMDNSSIGIAICLRNNDALKAAATLADAFKHKMMKALINLEKENTRSKKAIQYFYEDDAALAGHVAGIAMPYLFDQEKPTIALSRSKNDIKVSLRGTNRLISKGLDLATAAKESAESVGGVGGGHPIAAGATVPKDKETQFLDAMDVIVSKQLSAGKSA
jgi:RecJ-like exonuclease